MSQVMVAYRMMACRMHACIVSPLPAGGEWNPDTPGSNVLECVHNGAAPGAVPWQHEGYLLMTNAVYHVNVSRRYQLPRPDLTRSRCLKCTCRRCSPAIGEDDGDHDERDCSQRQGEIDGTRRAR